MTTSDVGAKPEYIRGRSFSRRNETAEQRAARRQQLVDAAVGLFVKQGYHETTTREIAQAAGWSVGTLYEYVTSKSDILYRVCEVIHEETELLLQKGQVSDEPIEQALRREITTYFQACDARQDVILLIYQEINCLSHELRGLVMKNEERMTSFFYNLIQRGVDEGTFRVESEKAAHLIAHNITVFGQMWAFRRWHVQKHFTLDEYTAAQTQNIMRDLMPR